MGASRVQPKKELAQHCRGRRKVLGVRGEEQGQASVSVPSMCACTGAGSSRAPLPRWRRLATPAARPCQPRQVAHMPWGSTSWKLKSPSVIVLSWHGRWLSPACVCARARTSRRCSRGRSEAATEGSGAGRKRPATAARQRREGGGGQVRAPHTAVPCTAHSCCPTAQYLPNTHSCSPVPQAWAMEGTDPQRDPRGRARRRAPAGLTSLVCLLTGPPGRASPVLPHAAARPWSQSWTHLQRCLPSCLPAQGPPGLARARPVRLVGRQAGTNAWALVQPSPARRPAQRAQPAPRNEKKRARIGGRGRSAPVRSPRRPERRTLSKCMHTAAGAASSHKGRAAAAHVRLEAQLALPCLQCLPSRLNDAGPGASPRGGALLLAGGRTRRPWQQGACSPLGRPAPARHVRVHVPCQLLLPLLQGGGGGCNPWPGLAAGPPQTMDIHKGTSPRALHPSLLCALPLGLHKKRHAASHMLLASNGDMPSPLLGELRPSQKDAGRHMPPLTGERRGYWGLDLTCPREGGLVCGGEIVSAPRHLHTGDRDTGGDGRVQGLATAGPPSKALAPPGPARPSVRALRRTRPRPACPRCP